ncbi:bacillithiol system redox-active protein YtxJ [Jeotgalibacillus proteolyticus]|uniref:bacillithiol system redox-active protein YtxJ n=1 Tax=Jeotgalibacillus proteolyticus TaxID=2082395 RepID=UPI003CF43CA6
MNKIDSIDEFNELLSTKQSFFLLKHSLTCPISASAYEEYKKFDAHKQADTYYLAVQESKELSAYIADQFGVKHESPQALYFKDKKPVWSASHFKIKEKALKDQLQ